MEKLISNIKIQIEAKTLILKNQTFSKKVACM